MEKLQVKKIIALGLTLSFIILSVYNTIITQNVSEAFTNLVIMVVSYYFGRSHGEEKQ